MLDILPQYIEALCQEQRLLSSKVKEKIPVGTIFFGGGTPSLLKTEHLQKILETASECFDLMESLEVTLEANPGTVTAESLKAIRSLGINRISFGMQSAHPGDLQILNRQHIHGDVIQAVAWCKQIGFEHINLDLIFGIPGQTLDRWENTLDLALQEHVDHFSLYSLSVEDGTPLKKWIDHGLLTQPDNDLAADMYETAMDKLAQEGFIQYEISNWVRDDGLENRCLHNLQYWRYLPYLGFGAGAHGFINGVRTENISGIDDYISRIATCTQTVFPAGPAYINSISLSNWEQMQEYLMVSFRLTDEGVSRSDFLERFGKSIDATFEKQLSRLLRQGLIEIHPKDQDRLRLTRRGRLFGNQVFVQFVGNREPAINNL